MELQKIKGNFSICKLSAMEQLDFKGELFFIAKTHDEISLVCETDFVPPNSIAVEHGWRALKITGILDFNLVGIVAKISNILADANISIFVVSTYNTDYILLKDDSFDEGVRVLVGEGYFIDTK